IVEQTAIPIICGGLISDKEDVIGALSAGAAAISSTNQKVWKL
ncbi:MAG: glycerol-3-phosphate responsive antiterminator, partial [Firmicutes bacterium]|nr:glycerol-3-phosphate responsive antiterminator [Bacillota bacterium]